MASYYGFEIHKNEFLASSLTGYFSVNFESFKQSRTLSFLHILKNTKLDVPQNELNEAKNTAKFHIATFLANHIKHINGRIVVCRIPRSKTNFADTQLYFQKAVREAVTLANPSLANRLIDGVDYIKRVRDVATTHLASSEKARAAFPQLCAGDEPYKGITKDTCTISNEIKNQTILLIDDIYTLGVNVVEDCIQALYDNGAKQVIFYAVGRTDKGGNTPAIEY